MGIPVALQSHQHTGCGWEESNTDRKEQTVTSQVFDQG